MRLMPAKRIIRAGVLVLSAGVCTPMARAQSSAPAPAPAIEPAPPPAVAPAPPPVAESDPAQAPPAGTAPALAAAPLPSPNPAAEPPPGPGQVPPAPAPFVAVGNCEPPGTRMGGAFHHVGRALQDGMIGYPDLFYEPPLGAFVNANRRIMAEKANPHRFTLYKTDFLARSNLFSPTGATRFNLMASRLMNWQGPILIEWSPDEPGLAEARRNAVVAALQRSGFVFNPDRVVMAPSPYPGGMGADGGSYYNVMIMRDSQAPATYSLTPVSASGFGGGGGGPR